MTWPRWLYPLTDPRDRLLADDKAAHLMGGALLWQATSGRWWLFALVAIGWELFELARWRRWQARGAPSPWPWATDLVSLKDLLADIVGIGLALLLPGCAR